VQVAGSNLADRVAARKNDFFAIYFGLFSIGPKTLELGGDLSARQH
jgi:hypothetical protein